MDLISTNNYCYVGTNKKKVQILNMTSGSYFGFSPEKQNKKIYKLAAPLSLLQRII
jgi:hypothetical protein